MLGWIFFISSCYIVTFMAKCIYSGINQLVKSIIKGFKSIKYTKANLTHQEKQLLEYANSPEGQKVLKELGVDNNVH